MQARVERNEFEQIIDKGKRESYNDADKAVFEGLKNKLLADKSEKSAKALEHYIQLFSKVKEGLHPLSREARDAAIGELKSRYEDDFLDQRSNEGSYIGGGGNITSRREYNNINGRKLEEDIQRKNEEFPNAEFISNFLRELDANKHIAEIRYQIAHGKLFGKWFDESNNKLVSTTVFRMCLYFDHVKKQKKCSTVQLGVITDVMENAVDLLEKSEGIKRNPLSYNHLSSLCEADKAFNQSRYKYLKSVSKLSKFDRKAGRLAASVALSLTGALLIATSIALSVVTFGVSTPISVAGMALGVQIAAGGVIGAAAITGTTMSVGFGIFADRDRKGELAYHAEKLADSCRKFAN